MLQLLFEDEKDEIKGMNKKMPYLDVVGESDKLGERSASDYINGGEVLDIIEGNSVKNEIYEELGSD